MQCLLQRGLILFGPVLVSQPSIPAQAQPNDLHITSLGADTEFAAWTKAK